MKMLQKLGVILSDEDERLAKRFRALFALRNIKGEKAIEYIGNTALRDSSALLKHECCFCLGQMQDQQAITYLTAVLTNKEEHPMVRHEAAEALGAIGAVQCVSLLESFCDDKSLEVSQTCQLAVQRIKWLQSEREETKSVYNSVDPTPAATGITVDSLREVLLNKESTLYDKYAAMFALRNNGTNEAIKALGEALIAYKEDNTNALLKHEIAYVLGQIRSPISVSYLKSTLSNLNENEMVRHECAEALGSVANEEANRILEEFKNDSTRIVRESIEVAMDMSEYENSDQFSFLNDRDM